MRKSFSKHQHKNIQHAVIDFCGVEDITVNAAAAFTVNSSQVFRDDIDITPVTLSNGIQYIPWGADNMMPYNILDMIEKDETLSTCQMFNAEICYGSGLQYNTSACSSATRSAIEDFLVCNNLAEYFLGVCQDFKHYGWCVSVIIVDKDGKNIVRLHRKEVVYCRFSKANKKGIIEYVLYANWKKPIRSIDEVEAIPLLNPDCPFHDLVERLKRGSARKFALVSRVPTPDCTYYPIPYYAALFRGKWYNIKQLIGMAKEAKLKNSAPIKYHIEVSQRYWENIFKRERITNQQKMQERVKKEKRQIIDFLTGAERSATKETLATSKNSGKALFSTFYVSPTGEEQHEVVINKIDSDKEGGDWATDIQEAVNMFCFTMRVHSNLVGSVPGKAQTNNSGSDKRELCLSESREPSSLELYAERRQSVRRKLYTIAQALQKPYHDLLFTVHRIIMKFNQWKGAYPECPFIQLTTLDEGVDAKRVSPDTSSSSNE